MHVEIDIQSNMNIGYDKCPVNVSSLISLLYKAPLSKFSFQEDEVDDLQSKE